MWSPFQFAQLLLLLLFVIWIHNSVVVGTTLLVTTIAGQYHCCARYYTGDGGPASSSDIHDPYGIFGDTAGNIYIAEYQMDTVRKISTSGIITTIAGSSTEPASFSGDGGVASSAKLNTVYSIWCDSNSNIYISDQYNYRIRKITASTGIISTIAGNGGTSTAGDNGPATSAGFSMIRNVWGDSSGKIYIADDVRIRMIRTAGIISTIAGGGSTSAITNGLAATSAALTAPDGGSTDTTGIIYFSDSSTNIVRKISGGSLYNIGTSTTFSTPKGLFVTTGGDLYIADSNHHQIKVISTSTDAVTVVVGTGSGDNTGDGGLATSAKLNQPYSVWVSTVGDIYIAEHYNAWIRKAYVVPDPTTPPTMTPTVRPTTFTPTFPPSKTPTALPTITPTQAPTFPPTNAPSRVPTFPPTITPTATPTIVPSLYPSVTPSTQPTVSPTLKPTATPTTSPTLPPTFAPTKAPTPIPTFPPTFTPTKAPTVTPSLSPTVTPTIEPTTAPTATPTFVPTPSPTIAPSVSPSETPSEKPSEPPSCSPTYNPTRLPTLFPTVSPAAISTRSPTCAPSTATPTAEPSIMPSSVSPTLLPSLVPTQMPSLEPTCGPSFTPTVVPSQDPSQQPTWSSTYKPTNIPSLQSVTGIPSIQPTSTPSTVPSALPSTVMPVSDLSKIPIVNPSSVPSGEPSHHLTETPSIDPSQTPTVEVIPTIKPSVSPPSSAPVFTRNPSTVKPSFAPSVIATQLPTSQAPVHIPTSMPSSFPPYLITLTPSRSPSLLPSPGPSKSPTAVPTQNPSFCPTIVPSLNPTFIPTTRIPSYLPTWQLSVIPSETPTEFPSLVPSKLPTKLPTEVPSTLPSMLPTTLPTTDTPTIVPSVIATSHPTITPTTILTVIPSAIPSIIPSIMSSLLPSVIPSEIPTMVPSVAPSVVPTVVPSLDPSASPSVLPSLLPSITPSSVGPTSLAPSFTPSTYPTSLRPSMLPSALPTSFAPSKSPTLKSSVAPTRFPTTIQPSTVAPSLPLIPIVDPVVVISIPSTISSCSSLLFDVSSSTGHYGKPWNNVTIDVIGVDASEQFINVTQLSQFVSSFKLDQATMIVPSSLLIPTTKYAFTVTLCNYWNRCSQSSKTVEVVDTIAPLITIAGGDRRVIRRSNELSLYASGSTPSCDGSVASVSGQGLSYNWTVYKTIGDGHLELVRSLRSVSSNPARFFLPAFALTSKTQYSVIVTATSISSKQSTSASIQVVVEEGSIVGRIVGSKMKSMRQDEMIVLDASSSYDEDAIATDSMNDLSGLAFSWKCTPLKPVALGSCGDHLIISVNQTLNSLVTVRSASSTTKKDSEFEVEIQVIVSDVKNQSRYSIASTVVTVLPVLSAVISLTSSLSSSYRLKMNPSESLKLMAVISSPVMLNNNLTWQLNDKTIDLSAVALTPVSSNFIASSVTSALKLERTVYLVLPSNILAPGRSYTFSLTSTLSLPGVASSSSITIDVNNPPTPGSLLASPESGIELSTMFTFSCSLWVDEDLPLTYAFGYLSDNQQQQLMMLRSRNELSYTSSLLIATKSTFPSTMIIQAQIFDSYLASTLSERNVIIQENVKSQTVTDLVSLLLNSSSPSINNVVEVDELKQSTTLATTILNRIDCSLSPNCSQLHRKACSRTINTCGECLSDDYIGEKGDANTPCYFSSTTPLILIAAVPKPCTSNCSYHGSCVYTSIKTGAVVSTCNVGQLDCQTSCACDEGYHGSVCSLSDEELEKRQESREEIIQRLKILVAIEDPTSDAITSWVTSLSQATTSYHELKPGTITTVLDVVTGILNASTSALASFSSFSPVSTTSSSSPSSSFGSSSSGLEYDIDQILSVIDTSCKVNAFMVGTVASLKSGTKRRRLTNTSPSIVNSTFIAIQRAIQRYVDISSQSLVPGLAPVQKVRDTFRLSVASTTISGGANTCQWMHVSPPLKIIDRWLNISYGSMKVFTCSNPSSSTSDALVAMTSLSKEVSPLDHHVLESNINSITLNNIYCDQELYPKECGYMEVSLIRKVDEPSKATYFTSDVNETTPVIIETECREGNKSIHSYTCPSRPLEVMTIQCNGSAAILTSYCPTKSHLSQCQSLSGVNIKGSGCHLKEVTATSIVCLCPLSSSSLVSSMSGKRLLTSSSTSTSNITRVDEMKVSFVGMTTSIWSNFVTTFKSPKNLQDTSTLKRGIQVFVTLGLFTLFIVFGIAIAYRLDDKELKKVESEEMMKKQKINQIQGVKKQPRLSLFTNTVQAQACVSSTSSSSSTSTTTDILQLAEEALPQVLKTSKSLWKRMLHEIKSHHRWFAVMFTYCHIFPRPLRIMSLATNVIIMLFIQSITYNLTHSGDEAMCSQYLTEESCLSTKSPYETGSTMCYWISPGQGDSSTTTTMDDAGCHYIEPADEIKVTIFVAIFSALVASPIALICDWIILNILAAPTRSSVLDKEDVPLAAIVPEPPSPAPTNQSTSSIVARRNRKSQRSSVSLSTLMPFIQQQDKSIFELQAQQELNTIAEKVAAYRMKIPSVEERKEFDTTWGLNSNDGKFLLNNENRSCWAEHIVGIQSVTSVADAILEELQEIHVSLHQECKNFQQKQFLWGEEQQNRRLLLLFQRDLLPGISGQILESKEQRELPGVSGGKSTRAPSTTPVAKQWKYVGWFYLVLQDLGMLFYVLLFALNKTSSRQQAWVRSFAIWLVMEILVISTLMVLFMHILLPIMVMKDIQHVREKLTRSIEEYQERLRTEKEKEKETRMTTMNDDSKEKEENVIKRESNNEHDEFNAAEYLFLSYRLAKEFSHLTIAKIILQYQTPWPKRSYQYTTDATQSQASKQYNGRYSALYRSMTLVFIFVCTNVLNVPVDLQDLMMKTVLTTIVGSLLYVQSSLYRIHPVLVVIPYLLLISFVIGCVVLCMKWCGRHNSTSVTSGSINNSGQGRQQTVVKTVKNDREMALPAVVMNNNREDEGIVAEPLISSVSAPNPLPQPSQSNQFISRRQSVQMGVNLLRQGKQILHESDDVIDEVENFDNNRRRSSLSSMSSKSKRSTSSSNRKSTNSSRRDNDEDDDEDVSLHSSQLSHLSSFSMSDDSFSSEG